MGIIEKKALKKNRGKRSACMKRENRKGNKVQLLRTWRLSQLTSSSVFPQIWRDTFYIWRVSVRLACQNIQEKNADLWMNESTVGKPNGFP